MTAPAENPKAALTDEQLAETIAVMEKAIARMRDTLDSYRGEAMRRLGAREAKEGIWGGYKVAIKPATQEYVWNSDELKRSVKPLLAPGEWEHIFTEFRPLPYIKPNRSDTLLNLAKRRGGELQAAVERAYHIKYKTAPNVKVEELEQ